MSGHYADGQEPGDEEYRAALRDVVAALDGSGLRHLFIGGVGTATLARPRYTDDIDILVHPEDAGPLLDRLAAADFEVERTEPSWLFKAFRHGVLVDVIFRSTGEIYLDDEMVERSQVEEYKGQRLRVVPPEDLLVIKAVAASESNPHHWFDALGVISGRHIDWEYLVSRARRFGPRRVLSLLLYAESIDLAVSASAIETLFREVHPLVDRRQTNEMPSDSRSRRSSDEQPVATPA